MHQLIEPYDSITLSGDAETTKEFVTVTEEPLNTSTTNGFHVPHKVSMYTATEEPRHNLTSNGFDSPDNVLGTPNLSIYDDKTIPIAIIGMSCRFPGDANNVERFWELISQGRSAWSEIPPRSFNASAFYHPNKDRIGIINARGGYFLEQDLSHFDAQFFSINPEEAKAMDPQQRILLECTYEALENAGLPLKTVAGSNTSVFTATFNNDYEEILLQDLENTPLYHSTGTAHSILANRLSYFFNLKGPSIAVDTACSGSLIAFHLACQSLRSSESKQAIVGGSNVILNPDLMAKMTPMGFFSPDGKCYTFDDRASGYARGEGVAAIILKPLSDAIRDGDPIRAVIRESVVNSDGRTAGITMPSREAQENLIRSAYLNAGLNPLETGYVEAHGTGTQAGDPIEAGAIASIFGPGRPVDKPLLIGSVKTNVGHLEGASGLAGIIKAVMILEKGFIPPSLNFENANSRIPLEKWKLKVPRKLEKWPSTSACRVSVNSFGFGGTNGHAIIESFKQYQSSKDLKRAAILSENPTPELVTNGVKYRRQVFLLNSGDQKVFEIVVHDLLNYLQKHKVNKYSWFSNLAYTLGQRRSILPWKLAISAISPANLIEALQARPRPSRSSKIPRLGFVFTGQGAQWWAMGRELMDAYPIFKSSLETADKYLQSFGAPWSILIELKRDAQSTCVNIASISQPISTAIQIALVDLLDSWGIKPIAALGHSSGEAAAAYAAHALSMKSALLVTYCKGLLIKTLKDKAPYLKGAMMAVGLSQEDTETHISKITSGKIVVACINSPVNVTVSGDNAAIDELYSRLESENIFVRKLKIDTAYHSFHMDPISDDYFQALKQVKPILSPEIQLWSSVTGGLADSIELDASYWVRHMVSPVRFSEALRNLCLQSSQSDQRQSSASEVPVDILVEIGPHSALAGPIKQILKGVNLDGSGIIYAPSLVRGIDAILAAQQLVCTLLVNGYPVDLNAVNFPNDNESKQVIVDMPPYPWNHTVTHWHESRLSLNHRFREYSRHDLLGAPVIDFNELEPKWRNIIRVSDMPWVKDHRVQSTILYPAAGFLVMAIEAMVQSTAQQKKKVTGFRLRDVSFSKALVIPETSDGIETSFTLRPFADNSFSSSSTWKEFRIFSHNELEGWSEHCRGLISAEFHSQQSEVDGGREGMRHASACKLRYANAKFICGDTVAPQNLYESFNAIGLQFGSTFQNLINIRRGSGQVLSTLVVPNTGAVMPHNFEYPHLIHPATLDAALQAVLPAIASENNQFPGPMLPTFIKELFIAKGINNLCGHEFLLHVSASHKRVREVAADLAIVDPLISDSSPVVEAKDCRYTLIGNIDLAEQNVALKPLCFKLRWDLDVDFLKNDAIQLWNMPYNPETSAKLAQLDPHALVQEDGLFHEFYNTSISMSQIAAQMVSYIDKLAFKYPSMNILEIGASDEGGTLRFLQTLGGYAGKDARFSHYDYTNASSEHFEKVRTKFRDWSDLISFKKLEIERDPESQGFQNGEYDLVISFNSSHSTSSMDATMKNIRKLLKQNGKFITIETTRPMLHNSIVFGTLPDQWRDVEKTPKFGSTLSESQLNYMLEEHSFNLDLSVPDFPAEKDHMNSLIVASVAGEKRQYPPVTLVYDGTMIGISMDTLNSSFATVTGVDPIISTLEEAQPEGKVCIFLSELHEPMLKNPSIAQFDSIKSIFSAAKGVLWVSRGGSVSCEKPEVSLITGLLRTLRFENQASKFTSLDLDALDPLGDDAAASAVLDVFKYVFDISKDVQGLDVEFAERNGNILIPRVFGDDSMNGAVMALTTSPKPELQPFHQPDRFLSLDIEKPGLLDSLRFVDNPKIALPLAEDEVEMEIKAAGLNFLDIMLSMDQIPMSLLPMGSECSGVIRRMGKDVTDFRIGDRVCGWATNCSAFSNVIRTPALMAQRIPDDMTFETAVSIPTAYCTVSVSLVDTAHLQKGETVLIHAAAGAVGQAAILFARLIGAEIFATVGSTSKKHFIMERYQIDEDHIFSSRDLSFAQGIMRMTNNKGVDVILNSLAGEALQQTWKCLAKFGRFIEIGKRDMVLSSRLDMAPFLRNVTFASVDLATIITHRPSYGARVFADVMKMFRERVLEPISPITVFSFSEMEAAFRLMQSGKHIGKIAIVPKADDQIKALPKPLKPLIRPDASYLLVGGLGGLGRSISSWMMQCGAKNIILLSRSGLINESAKELVRELEEGGVRVAIYACDVSNETQLDKALQDCANKMPPIRGVIQSAMVLRDTPFENLSIEKFREVTFPKVQGSWNLHKQLSQTELDFFIMLSSLMGVVGNGAQASYTAASSFQDALAYHRNSLGLPAVTLDVGMIVDAGYVSENAGVKEKIERQGFIGIPIKDLLAILQCAITQSAEDQSSQIITGLHAQNMVDMKLGKPVTDIHFWLQDPRFSHLLRVSSTQIAESKDGVMKFDRILKNARSLNEASQTVLDAIMAKLSKYLLITKEDIDSSQPITACGVDSLVAVELRNWMMRELKAEVPTFKILGSTSLHELSLQVAQASKLLNPVLRDGAYVEKSLDTHKDLRSSVGETRTKKLHALVEKYSVDLPFRAQSYSAEQDDGWTVVLTGSTGSLGSHLLDCLLTHPKVVRIICLNRSSDGRKKQAEISSSRGLTTHLAAKSVEFYQVSFDKERLGLQADKHEFLLSSATHIIHNAWQLDFLSPVESFEAHIHGVRQLLDLSFASAKNARIIFVSTVASVMKWSDYHSGDAPEDIVNDYNVASDYGYGESKHVAERLLYLANERTGIRVSILRAGQIAGPVLKQGVWNKREWLPGIIASSKHLGLLPDSLSIADAINWLPVDILSKIIVEIIETRETKDSNTFEIMNVVNPHTTSWKTLLPTVQAYLSRNQSGIKIVSFDEWVDALQASGVNEPSVSIAQNPALSLLEFYLMGRKTALGSISKLESKRAVAASQSLAALEAVGTEWMEIWLNQWDF